MLLYGFTNYVDTIIRHVPVLGIYSIPVLDLSLFLEALQLASVTVQFDCLESPVSRTQLCVPCTLDMHAKIMKVLNLEFGNVL